MAINLFRKKQSVPSHVVGSATPLASPGPGPGAPAEPEAPGGVKASLCSSSEPAQELAPQRKRTKRWLSLHNGVAVAAIVSIAFSFMWVGRAFYTEFAGADLPSPASIEVARERPEEWIKASTMLRLYDEKTKQWKELPQNENLTASLLSRGTVMLQVSIDNLDSVPHDVNLIGFGLGETTLHVATDVRCGDAAALVDCKFPFSVGPLEGKKVFVNMSSADMETSFRCNDYSAISMELFVDSDSQALSQWIPQSGYYAGPC